jgi:hypothetical protein
MRATPLGEGELRRSIYRHEEVQFTLTGSDLGDIDVKVADGIAFERPLGRLVAGDLGQSADPVMLQAPVQGRPVR